jgi:hydrogenase expression/formation protein HypC
MCLGIPMEVIAIDGHLARCRAKGIERDVSLFMLQDETIVPGDHVVVHVGYALQKLTEQQARSVWETYDAMLALEDADDAGADDV